MKYYQIYNKIRATIKAKKLQRIILLTSHLSLLTSAIFLTSHFSPLTSTIHAQEQKLRVSPVIMNITLSPGKVSSQDVTIENLSSTPLPLRATLSDFMTGGEEGGYIFEETKTNPLLSWIELNENEFILNPKEKKTIKMTIKIPKSISLGGYYGVLFFEPVLQGEQAQMTKVNSKVGILMLANVGVPDPNAKRAEILAFETASLDTDGTVPFLLRVKNISLNFFSAKPKLTITPLIGWNSQSRAVTLEEKTIFPGNVRQWEESATIQNLSPNIYKTQIAVSTGNGKTVDEEKYFVVFPVAYATIIVFIFLVLVFLIIKRRRLRKAISAILHT